jgi:GAF domain-containing protein
MVSASNFADDKLRAFEAGADDYISKPFRVKELQARIKVMLNLRKAERELRERNDQLLELIRVSEMINLRPDLLTTAEEVVKSAVRLAKTDRAYLLLWDEEKQVYHSIASSGSERDPSNIIFPGEAGLAGAVHREGRLILLPDYTVWEHRMEYGLGVMYETAGIPLRLVRRHIGVLVVGMKEPDKHFAPGDTEILTTLANQAAIAIDNAKL